MMITNLFDPNEEYANMLNRHLYERNKLVQENSEQLKQIFLMHWSKLGSFQNAGTSVIISVRQRAQDEFMEIERQQKTMNNLILKQIEEVSEFVNILSISYPGYCLADAIDITTC
jgi:hypothetical protein